MGEDEESTRMKGNSSRNHQEESIRERLFRRESPIHRRRTPWRNGFLQKITSLWMQIQTSKIKMHEKFSER
jgi:hypothetical protein